MTKHIHADLIHAWADGAEIQVFDGIGWSTVSEPNWQPNNEYRIKPEENKPVVRWLWAYKTIEGTWDNSDYFYTESEKPWGYTIKLEWSRTEFPE